MIEAYKKFWQNYVNFSGRSSRSDYWYTILCNVIISFLIGFVCGLFGESGIKAASIISAIYGIAMIIPGFAICIRRLHDINKSGWFLLLSLIPFVGAIILLVFYCMPSVDENNKYANNMTKKDAI